MSEIMGIPILGTLDSKTGVVSMQPIIRCDWCGKGPRGVKNYPKPMHPRCLQAFLKRQW